MRAFRCDVCTARVAFENSRCLSCGSDLGYSVSAGRVVALAEIDGESGYQPPAGPVERRCANTGIAACTWLAPAGTPSGLCLCCRLTRTRPADDDPAGLAAFARTEAAKRRLVHQLLGLGLPVVPWTDGGDLAFDLLSSRYAPVTTGHADGVITLDLAEGDDAHREAVRAQLGEPYRTLLGHLRHEIGLYYWESLVGGPGTIGTFRALFGDEREDYAAAVDRHYAQGPPDGWGAEHVSSYATMHPWEDWAETFAHYLHLRDVLETAGAYGLSVAGDPAGAGGEPEGIEDVVARWLPLSYGLNAVNRSMGKDDLYPFVLTPPLVAKLGVVHAAVRRARQSR